MTRSSFACRRGAALLALNASAIVLAVAGCGAADRPTRRAAPHTPTVSQTTSPISGIADDRSGGVPGGSPAIGTLAPAAPLATAIVPSPAEATRTAIGTAKAWATAANSSSYRDSSPGQWTIRARPFVTGSEAQAEAIQRSGGGGNTWAQIQHQRCATRLGGLVAIIPSDAPSGPSVHIVYVSARIVLACADGTDYLSDFAAQLTVQRVAGHWLVALVRH